MRSLYCHWVKQIKWHDNLFITNFFNFQSCYYIWIKLGSVAGPVIQANGRLSFDVELRPGGLLYCGSQWISVRTELADSMVTLGELKVLDKEQFDLLDTCSSSKHSWGAVVGFAGEWAQCRFPDQNRQTKIVCQWDDNACLGVRNNSDRSLAKLPCLEPAVILY